MSNRPVSVVIIGMGRMGRTRYEGMKRHGGYEIVGVCDMSASSLEAYPERKFTDWKECIDQCDSDAVVVCTYNDVIPDIVCYALSKGKHVFSEKPPGRNLNDTMRMKEESEKNPQCVLKFGFNHRYHNSIIEAKALIDSGILGELVCARGVYGKAGGPMYAHEWRNDIDVSGGGILLDQGIHMLDLLCYFMGNFTKVQSHVDTLVWTDQPTEDSAFVILENDNGNVASLHSSALQWRHKFDLDLICTNGYVALNGLITSTNSYGEERITYYKKDFDNKNERIGKPMEHTMCFDSDQSWDLEHDEFYNSITTGIPVKHGTIDESVQIMKLIEKIYSRK